jgi:hypothetical protein
MVGQITADFAKLTAQTAIGQGLRSHYGVSEELPSLFHSLIARMDQKDALRVAARFPTKPSTTLNRTAPRTAPAFRTDGAFEPGKTVSTVNSKMLEDKVAAFFARAEGARTAAETMQVPEAREAMFRLAETYKKVAENIVKTTGRLKYSSSKNG